MNKLQYIIKELITDVDKLAFEITAYDMNKGPYTLTVTDPTDRFCFYAGPLSLYQYDLPICMHKFKGVI